MKGFTVQLHCRVFLLILLGLMSACEDSNTSNIKKPVIGSLSVLSTPSGASIALDHEATSEITPHIFADLDTGWHSVRLSLAGYFEDSAIVYVSADSEAVLSLSLTQLSAPHGNIFISSTPTGAGIVLDNTNTGKTTPDSLNNLTPGNHTIKLSLAGYLDSTFNVTVVDGQTVNSSIALKTIPAGNIYVTSTPSGATIFLDSSDTGKNTPDSLKNLTPGTYSIRLSLTGYLDSTIQVMVLDGRTTDTLIALRAIPAGNIFVSSAPVGAAIFLNNANTGKVTPDSIKNLTPGDYTIKLTRNGYLDSTFQITVLDGQTSSASINLRAIPAGNIFVSSIPSGATVFLDNNNTGKLTPDSLKNLTPGTYSIKLTLTGYLDSTFQIAVLDGQTSSATITLRAIPAGHVFLSSTPSGAAIFLDNVQTFKTTPDSVKNIPVGNHMIRLTLAGYVDSMFTVAVVDMQTTVVSVNLRPVPPLPKVPQNIQDIFNNHCIACHSGSNPPQGQNLSDDSAYVHIVNVSSRENSSLKRILPFDPNNSYLVRKIQGTGISGGRMPLGGPYLTQTQIDSVRSWVTQGAPAR